MSTPCAGVTFVPAEDRDYLLKYVREGHVFAWERHRIVEPGGRVSYHTPNQYLCCIICRRPSHELFPPTKETDPVEAKIHGIGVSELIRWWELSKDSTILSGAVSGLDWSELWPEAREEVAALYGSFRRT
jgi:hypothetical protein